MNIGRFRFLKSKPLLAGAIGCSALAGWYVTQQATSIRPTRVAILREAKPPASIRVTPGQCAGGEEYLGRMEIVPDAVVTIDGRERVEYHGELTLKAGKGVAITWNAEVVNDKGEIVKAKILDRKEKRKGGDVAVSDTATADLPDGFYALHLKANLVPDEGPADIAEAIQYFNVKNGKWRELNSVEWNVTSSAGLATRTSDDSGAAK